MLAMASTSTPEASTGKDPPPVSPGIFVYPENTPMVWITQGKTDHAAHILKEYQGRKFVKWVASQLTQWVDADAEIKTELPRRRKGKRDSLNNEYIFPSTFALSKSKKNDVKSEAKTPKKAPKRVLRKRSSKGANKKKGIVNATKKKLSTSKKGKKLKLKHLIGTRVYKEFPPFGWFYGNVVELTEDGLYHILYEDDDEETLNEKEVDEILVDSSEDMHDPHEVQDEIGENDISDVDDSIGRVEQAAGENTASESHAQRRTGATSTLKINVRLNEQIPASHDDEDSSLQAIVSSPEELSAVLKTDSQIDTNEPVLPTTNHAVDAPSGDVDIRADTNLDLHDISKKRSSSLLYAYDTATTKKPRVTDEFLTASVSALRPKMTPLPKKSENEKTHAEKQNIPEEDNLDSQIHDHFSAHNLNFCQPENEVHDRLSVDGIEHSKKIKVYDAHAPASGNKTNVISEEVSEAAPLPVEVCNNSFKNGIGEAFPPKENTSVKISAEEMSAVEEAPGPVKVGNDSVKISAEETSAAEEASLPVKVRIDSSENGIVEAFPPAEKASIKICTEEMSAAEEASLPVKVGNDSSENGIVEAFLPEEQASVKLCAEGMSAAEEAPVPVKKGNIFLENAIGETFQPEKKASVKISAEEMSAAEEASIAVEVGNISSENAIGETFPPERKTSFKMAAEEISAAGKPNDLVCPEHGSDESSTPATPANSHKGKSSENAAAEVLPPSGMERVASPEYVEETASLAKKAGRIIPDSATIPEETNSLAPLSHQRVSAKIGEADRLNEFVEAYIEEKLEYPKDDNSVIIDGTAMEQDEVAAKVLDSSILIAKAQSPVADKSGSDGSSHPENAGTIEATTTPESSAAHVALPSKARRDSESGMNDAPLTDDRLNMASLASPSDEINTSEDRTKMMRYPTLVDKQFEDSGGSESKADDAPTMAAEEFVSRHLCSVFNQSEVSMRDNRAEKHENSVLAKHSEAFDKCSSVDELVAEEEHAQSESQISEVHDQSDMKPPKRIEHIVADDDSGVCAVEESLDPNRDQVSEYVTNEEIETFAAEADAENADADLQCDIEREQASSPDQVQVHLSSVNAESTEVVLPAETKFDNMRQSAAPDKNAYVASDGDNIETEAPTVEEQSDLVDQAAQAVQHGARATSSNSHSNKTSLAAAVAVTDKTTPEHAIKQRRGPKPGNRSDNQFTAPIFSNDETRDSCPATSNSPLVTKSFQRESSEPSLISLNGSLLNTDKNQEQRGGQSASAPYFRETAVTNDLDFGTESENELGVKSSEENSSEKLHTEKQPDSSDADDNASHGDVHTFSSKEAEKREPLNSVHKADKASQNTVVMEGRDKMSVDTASASDAAAWTKDAIEEVGNRKSPTTVTQNPPSQTRKDEGKHSPKSAKVLFPPGQGLERGSRDSAEMEVSETAFDEGKTLDDTIKVTDILTEGKATAIDMRDTESRTDDSDGRESKKSSMPEGDGFENGPAGTNTFGLPISQPDVSKISSDKNETILKNHDSDERSATVEFQHKRLEAEGGHQICNAKEYDDVGKNAREDNSGEHVAEENGNPTTAISLDREELLGLAVAMMSLPLSLPQKTTQLKGDNAAVDDDNKQLEGDAIILGKEPEPRHGEDVLAENDNDAVPAVKKELEHTEGVGPDEAKGVVESKEENDAQTMATSNDDSTADKTNEGKLKIVPPAPNSYNYGYSDGTCCPVCRQHIDSLVYCPVDWAKPLQYPTYGYAIDAIAEHVEECHKNEPIWNIIEAQLGKKEHQQAVEEHKRALENPESPPQNCISPQHFCRIALRHAIGCSFAIDESLQDMRKLRDMFIRRMGIARGFVQWSSDYFLYGRTCTNCRGDVVPGYEMRRSALLVLAYLEDHVMENAFNKNVHITEGYALTFPLARWRNMVQSVFLDPKGIENAWFMQDNNDRPYRKK